MPLCPHCSTVIEVADEDLIVPNHYWAILYKLSDQVPSQAHCDIWLDENGYDNDTALRVARAMENVLWADEVRGGWYTLKMNGTKEVRTYYKKIVLTWYSWMGRENQGLRRNGTGSETSMTVKKGTRY